MMKTFGFLALSLAVASCTRAAANPAPGAGKLDVMVAAPEHYKIRVDNDHVRVVENVLPAGGKDAMHTHAAGWYYVTQPGTMKVVHADGKIQMWEAKAGEAGWMDAEGPHTSENVGAAPMGFILVEVKR